MLRNRLTALLFLYLCLTFGIVFAQSENTRRLLTPQDLFEIKQVGSARISPDGDWVAYTVRETNLEEDESETRLWMTSTATGEVLPMSGVGSSVSEPRWSPDGNYLTFIASRNEGESQVWSLNRRGGEAVQLTEIEQGVNGYRWSPDGQRLLLLMSQLLHP